MANDIIKITQINSAGFGTISKLAMQDRRLHIAAKAIYAYFSSFAGSGDSCFPSRKRICYDLDVSNDTLGKYLKQLVQYGYLKIEQIKENGRFSHNVYTLCDTILPYPKISDTEDFVHGNLDTIINNDIINSISNNNNDRYIGKPKKSTRFQIPTLEEVKAYCSERNNGVDAQRFIDFYTSKGWMIGKNPMKDWKAAVRTWEKNSKKEEKSKETSYDLSEWEKTALNYFEE